MPEKVSGVRRKDQEFCALRGFQEGQLDKRGIEPIAIAFDDVSFWGGSVRCSTLPLSRD
jgi:N-dimethylarginine dimethylaminohydrolase